MTWATWAAAARRRTSSTWRRWSWAPDRRARHGAGAAAAGFAARDGGGGGGVVVLERHAELRATGAALTVFPNGWFALRALGIAHKLTPRYQPYETYVYPSART